MDNQNNLSRANRSKSRKSNNQILLFFVLLAVVFVIILFLLISFGNKERPKQVNDDENATGEIVQDDNQPSNSEETDFDANEADETVDSGATEDSERDRLKEFKIDVPEMDQADDNIIEIYSGNWDPIGTTQTGDHVTVYSNGSEDRVEIKMAVAAVTGIPENDMVEWFVGNGGDHQTAIANISDKALENYYKVYLSWIDHQGWQVSKVEKVHEYIEK